ncbi:MAG: polysaccharide biosynthesis/export family protein [Chitinophagaceae bacterium]
MRTLKLPAAAILLAAFFFTSCKSSKQLAYFQDLPDDAVSKIASIPYVPLRLQTNDEVQVTISSNSPEAAQYFNLAAVTPSLQANAGTGALSSQGGFINVYRVSSTGFITMPVIGEIPAVGATTEDLKHLIKTRLSEYLKDAVVTVNLVNFKVTVIGEVNRPVVIPVNGQTINVLEAVGASGDMTAFGVRRNVRIIRKLPDGNTEVAVLDFNKSNVMNSPYFQLRQNDIIYIQPNKAKSLNANGRGFWVPIITSAISIATIIITRR